MQSSCLGPKILEQTTARSISLTFEPLVLSRFFVPSVVQLADKGQLGIEQPRDQQCVISVRNQLPGRR